MDSENSTASSSPDVVPPAGFLSIKQVQELPNEALKLGQMVNVIGFLKDVQPPCKTSGTDFKCTLEVLDWSVRYDPSGLKLNIFRPENQMPEFEGPGDAVLVRNAKAQFRYGVPSLITHWSTEIHVCVSSRMPTSSSTSAIASWRSFHPKNIFKTPTACETNYVTNSKRHVSELPSTMDFQEKSIQAMQVKDKFALLKDVKNECFYNILGEVVQVYDDPSRQMTVHLSDYTANVEFYNHMWGGSDATKARDGDEHGYIKSRSKSVSNWPGPFGKMSLQLTLFDEHAEFVREEVKVKDWVFLRNVRIRYGRVGGCLEGVLHGDSGRVHVEVMESPENAEDIDPRWKAAISRKWDWDKKFAKEKKSVQDEASGKKRKHEDDPPKPNSKARRKIKRAGGETRAAAIDQKFMVKLNLNTNIRCEAPDQPAVLLADVLKARILEDHPGSGQQYHAPFDIRKFRANVRVVGYFPLKIEDFTVGRVSSEYDMLSDYSGGEDTNPEENMRAFRSGKGIPEKEWEWRFALQVVDVSDKSFVYRTWLLVNNHDAQMLLNMDATNLRKDKDALQEVREKLCILWGDLEERNSALAKAQNPKTETSLESLSPSLSGRKPGDQPPIDSDDEQESEAKEKKPSFRSSHETTALGERAPNAFSVVQDGSHSNCASLGQVQFSNKGFTCCVKEYGVKVKAEDSSLANAGDGKRWERKLGLFGTMII